MPCPLVAADAEDVCLDVTRSVTGRTWRLRPADDRLAQALAQSRALPEILGRVLAARGVTPDRLDPYLTPTLRHWLPDPSRLKDMDRACERLARALEAGEPIAIFADYDVDGATSAALLGRFLRHVGTDPTIYVPDRRTEGYGPNTKAMHSLRGQGVRVVVTVDCGTLSFEPLAAAAAAGLDVIVLDHHSAEPQLPQAVAVVNPNRLDDTTGLGHLCAAGVTFLTLVGLNRRLRAGGWYRSRPEPDLMAWLDLVAVGTVCDIAPLTGLNRALVCQGLKVLARRGNPGLAALADVGRLSEKPDAGHLGFLIGPRLNAGGRVGSADLGARLLLTEDTAEAAAMAERLDACNTERRALESAAYRAATEQLGTDDPGPVVFAASDDWHPGVTGLVASRLGNRYHRPACAVALDGDEGKGSGRSVPGIDLGATVIAAKQAGLLRHGGGHPMAAGFTVARNRLAELKTFLADRVGRTPAFQTLAPALDLDGVLSSGAATINLVEILDRLGPYGAGNPEPRFALPAVRVVRADVVGGQHVRCILSGSDGGRLKGIAFRALDGALGRTLLQAGGRPLHLAGTLRPDTWNGRSDAQLLIDDAAALLDTANPNAEPRPRESP